MGNTEDKKNREERIRRLEDKVERLERLIQNRTHNAPEKNQQRAGPANQKWDTSQTGNKRNLQKHRSSISWNQYFNKISDNWLYWLGTGFLLLGVLFLFKYSIDQGWLIPQVRSAFGLLTGLVLMFLGINSNKGKAIRQFLLGGGIAAFYITGFATFQLYSFISYSVVFGFMVAVTLLSFSISVQQNKAVLSILGTLGGLATPFLLYRGEGSLGMLMIYTALVISGAAAVYMSKGWKSLLWSKVTGGWLVLLIALFVHVLDVPQPLQADQWILQVSVLFTAVLFWILPVVREVVQLKSFKELKMSGDPNLPLKDLRRERPHVQLLVLFIPVLSFFYSMGIWTGNGNFWGGMAVISALVVGGGYFPLKRTGMKILPHTHAYSGLMLATISLFLLFDGEMLLVFLALEALGLRYIYAQNNYRSISGFSHLLFVIVGIWLAGRLFIFPDETHSILSAVALSELFVIVTTGLFVPHYLEGNKLTQKNIYRLAAHAGLLLWFLKELSVYEDGQAYVTIAWGLYALGILFSGFHFRMQEIRLAGMATVFLVVGKLFLIDLGQTSALFRIPLFMGFGIIFLIVGYYLQKYWGTEKSDNPIGGETDNAGKA